MIVTFVSQCEKKALPRTRRVLDAFANRIGNNTWQTVITEDGLIAVKKLLRKTVTTGYVPADAANYSGSSVIARNSIAKVSFRSTAPKKMFLWISRQ